MRAMLAFLLAALGTALGAAEAGPGGAREPTRLIIGFKAGASQAQREQVLKSLGARAVEDLDEFEAAVAEIPDGQARIFNLMETALAEPAVEIVEEDVYRKWIKTSEPSMAASPLPAWEEIRGSLPAFRKTGEGSINPLTPEIPWGVARVNAPAAWALTQGEGARVAVIDTGIDADHPDLKANFAGCYNAFDSNASCADDNGHGTHVAGTIAAAWDGKGVVGVAPQARLYAVKVLNKEGSSNLSSILKGLVWCGKHDIQVANMSLGAPIGSIFLRLALKYAASKGVAIVAAAGNNGRSVEYPAAYPEAIAVAASDKNNRIPGFSSRGPKVEFIAPGDEIKSTVPGGGYDWMSGTSMAAPHVTGLAALAVSRGARGLEGVRAALQRASRPLDLRPEEQGRGLIDAALIAR